MHRLRWLPLALVVALPLSAADDKDDKKTETIGAVERLDEALDDLIDKGAKIEKLGGGFAWTEGPVWVKAKGKTPGYLLFSDIPNNSVMKWQEGKKIELFLKPSGYMGKRTDFLEPGSNGLLIDPDGYLVLMEHGDHRVSRLELGKTAKDKKTLADKYDGKQLNSPNDGVFAKNGDLYITDPPYGRMLRAEKGGPVMKDGDLYFPDRELDFCGVYRLSKKDGKLTLLTKEMSKPNGIALSPDNKTLYVGNSDPKKAVWMSFPIEKDGKLGKGKVFFDASKWIDKKKGLPDGMKVDVKGNLWATGPGGVLVFTPQGKHLGTIRLTSYRPVSLITPSRRTMSASTGKLRPRNPFEISAPGRRQRPLRQPGGHYPLDLRLYLPDSWLSDKDRLDKAGVPEAERRALTKPEIALELLDSVRAEGLPGRAVVADAGYGVSDDFRDGLEARRLSYAVGVTGEFVVFTKEPRWEGTGKTLLVKAAAELFGVPWFATPATSYSRVGYVGPTPTT